MRVQAWPVVVGVIALTVGCSGASRDRVGPSVRGTYDKTSGKLTQIAYDRNHNGRPDTWTDMDGSRPIASRIDQDEDGTIDRWEYYDAAGALVKVGFSRKNNGTPDAWAYSRPDGSPLRIDTSSTSNESAIDRREFYEGGQIVRVEEDTNGDGRPDKWETYEGGAVKTVEIDENHDGRPDRRLTYANSELATIEWEPDATGRYLKKEAAAR